MYLEYLAAPVDTQMRFLPGQDSMSKIPPLPSCVEVPQGFCFWKNGVSQMQPLHSCVEVLRLLLFQKNKCPEQTMRICMFQTHPHPPPRLPPKPEWIIGSPVSAVAHKMDEHPRRNKTTVTFLGIEGSSLNEDRQSPSRTVKDRIYIYIYIYILYIYTHILYVCILYIRLIDFDGLLTVI